MKTSSQHMFSVCYVIPWLVRVNNKNSMLVLKKGHNPSFLEGITPRYPYLKPKRKMLNKFFISSKSDKKVSSSLTANQPLQISFIYQTALLKIFPEMASRPQFLPPFAILTVILALSVVANAQWTRFDRGGKIRTSSHLFSEEQVYSGRQTAPIAGIFCSGRYCDSKRLIIIRDGNSSPVQETGHWTRWFTDGNTAWADCPPDMLVNEVQCRGRYCDDMRLQCGRLNDNYRVQAFDLRFANWFSEEEGERLCPDGYYLWGMACRGDYCDGIRLSCARVDYIR